MILHLPCVPHTLPSRRFTHCAFTMKVVNAAKMWRDQGYSVIAYGAGDGAEVEASEWVSLMTENEQRELLEQSAPRQNDGTAFVGDQANTGTPCYQQFNYALRAELRERLEPGDVLCLPFGHAHRAAWVDLPIVEAGEVAVVETGIGYPNPATFYRVFESQAWRHWVLGYEQRAGLGWLTPRLEWIVPNYYDLADWELTLLPDSDAHNTVVYLGRLDEVKGLDLVPMLAQARPDLRFVLCGQGDPTPWLTERNIEYMPPISGRARAKYLGQARCMLAPSRMVEPFCGAAVEAMLCGTPVLSSDFGAFTETNIPGVTGFRCRDVSSWVERLDSVLQVSRADVRSSAAGRFSTTVVGRRYATVFEEIAEHLAARRVVNCTPAV